ncbi:MAG: DUF620 domain-containing protein [Holophaga sp.]|nr:DUF620 domain-containing protein [Holophaga sp.]
MFLSRNRTFALAAIMAASVILNAQESPKAAAVAAPQLPKAETLMEKYIEATGGRAIYAKQRTAVAKGTMEITAMGLKGAMTLYRAEPNLSYTEIDFPSLGKMKEGFDGKVAWAFSAMQGPQIKEGDEKISAAREAHFHSENWKEIYKQVQTLGVETVEGKVCFKVELTPHQGSPTTNFYDQTSGLLIKSVSTVKTAMGEITAELLLSDYRKVDGLLAPFKIVTTAAGQVILITLDSMAANAPIPEGAFEPPAEIKALLVKK